MYGVPTSFLEILYFAQISKKKKNQTDKFILQDFKLQNFVQQNLVNKQIFPTYFLRKL